jgi:integrase
MLPAPANAPSSGPPWPDPQRLLDGYLAALAQRGAGNSAFATGARAFLRRWPDPQQWVAQPLPARLSMWSSTRPLINHLMLFGHVRPGYDYLLERKLPAVLREARTSPLAGDLDRFLTAATTLGFTAKTAAGMASQVLMRLLIQTSRSLDHLREVDLAEFDQAISDREAVNGKSFKHYRTALAATRTVLYHLGAPVAAPVKNCTHLRLPDGHQFIGVPEPITASLVRYLECAAGTRKANTVAHMAGRLGHFVRTVAEIDPPCDTLAGLDRQRHIEPYLAAVAAAVNPRTGAPLSASERRSRILTVGRMIDDMIEWGWVEAPVRRLIFPRDVPRLPRPLPRYLPADADRRLTEALHAWPNRLRADALLLLRATGMRIGELRDLELDCVHEVPGAGAWLKIPLGKLDSERMVPLDDETVALVDRIVEHRSPGRPLPHPRTGKPVEFLLTHQGRRVSVDTLRDELASVAEQAGVGSATPHQLRHTYATALVNSGVSLQALMALLGHVSAEMSLRYGKLFDATVRADYEKALSLAKSRLGPVLPERSPLPLTDITGGRQNWQEAELIKTRLSGGYCLRTAAQGSCSYANICEHCPNLRTDATFLPILAAQRADAAALAADAAQRGWTTDAARHNQLVERLDRLIAQAHSA